MLRGSLVCIALLMFLMSCCFVVEYGVRRQVFNAATGHPLDWDGNSAYCPVCGKLAPNTVGYWYRCECAHEFERHRVIP